MVSEGGESFQPVVSTDQFKHEADRSQMFFDAAQEMLDKGDLVRATVLTMSMLVPDTYPIHPGENPTAFGNPHGETLRDLALPLGDTVVEGNVHDAVGLAQAEKRQSTELQDDNWVRQAVGRTRNLNEAERASAITKLRHELRNTRERQFLIELADRWVEVSRNEPTLLAEGKDFRGKLRRDAGNLDGLLAIVKATFGDAGKIIAAQLDRGNLEIQDLTLGGLDNNLSVDELQMAVTALRFVPNLVREASSYERNSVEMRNLVTSEQIDIRLITMLSNSHLNIGSAMRFAEALARSFGMDLKNPSSDPLVSPNGKRVVPTAGRNRMDEIVRRAATACLDSSRGTQLSDLSDASPTTELLLQADRLGREFAGLDGESVVLDGQSTLRSRVWQSLSSRIGREISESFYLPDENKAPRFNYERFEGVVRLMRSGKLQERTWEWLGSRMSKDAMLKENVAFHMAKKITDGLNARGSTEKEMLEIGKKVDAEQWNLTEAGFDDESIKQIMYGERGVVAKSLAVVTERIFEQTMPNDPAEWNQGDFAEALGKYDWEILLIFTQSITGRRMQNVSGLRGYGESLRKLSEAMGKFTGLAGMVNGANELAWEAREMPRDERTRRILFLDRYRTDWSKNFPVHELGKMLAEAYPSTETLMKELGEETATTA